MLREELVALILERGWDAIRVQDICDRADVGRSTFYTHFADKEDLLISGFDDLRVMLRGQHAVPKGGAGKPLAFADSMIEHAGDHRRLFRALVGKRSGLAVQNRFRQLVIDLVAEDLTTLGPPGPQLDATVHYLSGAFFELLIWWLDARTPLKAADVAASFHRLTTPVLAALRRRSM